MKFEINNLKEDRIVLFGKSHIFLINLGDIYLYKENKKNKSFYYQHERKFDYHRIKNAFRGNL